MEAAHAADMDAMTKQLADSAGALAAKEAVVRFVITYFVLKHSHGLSNQLWGVELQLQC